MNWSELEHRLEKSTHLINEIRSAESVLDELFFSRPTISVAPPPVDFFHSYTKDAYDTVEMAKVAHAQQRDASTGQRDSLIDAIPAQSTSTPQTDITYPENFGEIIGHRIREHRSVAGVTQKQLAEQTGIKRPNIARLEKGQSLPNLATLLKVSSALHISIQELLTY